MLSPRWLIIRSVFFFQEAKMPAGQPLQSADTKEWPHHCSKWHQCPDGSCKDFLERGWCHRDTPRKCNSGNAFPGFWNDVRRWQLAFFRGGFKSADSVHARCNVISRLGTIRSGQDGTGVWYGYFQSASCHAFLWSEMSWANARFQVRKHWPVSKHRDSSTQKIRLNYQMQLHSWQLGLTSLHHFRWARQVTIYGASLLGSNMLTSQCHTAIAWSKLMWSSKLFIKLSEIEPQIHLGPGCLIDVGDSNMVLPPSNRDYHMRPMIEILSSTPKHHRKSIAYCPRNLKLG